MANDGDDDKVKAGGAPAKQQQPMDNDKTNADQPIPTGKEKQTMSQRIKAALPEWAATPLTTPKNWKVLIRCVLASWVSFIILLPTASLQTLGTAGFFALLSSIFMPPYLPVQLFIFLMATLFVGLLFGWGVGAAAMRAAIAVRPQAYLQAVYGEIQAGELYQQNPTLAVTQAIFHGEFLHRFSSVMYGVFLGVSVFVIALARAHSPKLIISSIFGMIAVDIFCSYGPLFPTPQYMLLTSVLKSSACYMAIGLIFTLLVFPESMNHAVLSGIHGQLSLLTVLLRMQESVLSGGYKSEEVKGKMKGLGRKSVDVYKQLQGAIGMLTLEVSVGRWSAEDVKELFDPLGAVVARMAGLQTFVGIASAANDASKSAEDEAPSAISTKNGTDKLAEDETPLDVRLLRHMHEQEQASGLSLASVLPTLLSSTAPLRNACVRALEAIQSYLNFVNTTRWPWASTGKDENGNKVTIKEKEAEMDRAYEDLERVLKEFVDSEEGGRMSIVRLFLSSSSEVEGKKGTKPMRSLYISFVFSANLVSASRATLALLSIVRTKAERRRKNRVWAPGGLRAIWKLVMGKEGVWGDKEDGVLGEETDRVGLGKEHLGDGDGVRAVSPAASSSFSNATAVHGTSASTVKAQGSARTNAKGREPAKASSTSATTVVVNRRDPDSRPPSNLFQHIMNGGHNMYQWFGQPETIFALKTVIVTIALWIPAVVKDSAWFYYSNRGLWALIMAQTMMTVYAADQIFNLVVRLGGTLAGLLLGLLTWYIGNAKSNGSPYGSAAVVGVILFPLMFMRLNAPQMYLQGIMLTGATWVLIVGYSWIDAHLTQFVSLGLGWSVAWRRWVTVVIGAAAAFLMMMAPPTSARKAVRRKNARIISMLGGVYAGLIAVWLAREEERVDEEVDEDKEKEKDVDVETAEKASPSTPSNLATITYPKWVVDTRSRVLLIAASIASTRDLASLARWEGGIRGSWPHELYDRLGEVQAEMVRSLAQLSGALNEMSEKTRSGLSRDTKVLHPHFISDVMSVFTTVSQALHTAEPLHQVTLADKLMKRLLYHHRDRVSLPRQQDNDRSLSHESTRGMIIGANTDEAIHSVEYMYYCTAVVAVYQILQQLDEMHSIARELCGEVVLPGFEAWKQEYERERYLA